VTLEDTWSGNEENQFQAPKGLTDLKNFKILPKELRVNFSPVDSGECSCA